MKCIKSIKTYNKVEAGTIQRIDDAEAESKVRSGNWVYISKTEYKKLTPKPVEEKVETVETNKNKKNTKK